MALHCYVPGAKLRVSVPPALRVPRNSTFLCVRVALVAPAATGRASLVADRRTARSFSACSATCPCPRPRPSVAACDSWSGRRGGRAGLDRLLRVHRGTWASTQPAAPPSCASAPSRPDPHAGLSLDGDMRSSPATLAYGAVADGRGGPSPVDESHGRGGRTTEASSYYSIRRRRPRTVYFFSYAPLRCVPTTALRPRGIGVYCVAATSRHATTS